MFSVSEKSKNQIPYTSRNRNRPDISFNTENRRPLPEADPGFPRRWTPTPELGTKSITWQDLCRKLHENERNWTERGRASLAPPGSVNARVDPTIWPKFQVERYYKSLKQKPASKLSNRHMFKGTEGECERISHIILPESLIPEMFSNFYENVPFFPKQDMWSHSFDNGGTRLAFGEVTFY